jgi:YD repeat-containing protein
MAKKVNKRKARNGRAAGTSGKRARPRNEPASRPLTANGPTPLGSGYNGLVTQLPYDRLQQVTTYVYDGQNQLTTIQDPGEQLASFPPDAKRVGEEQQGSSRKPKKHESPQKKNNTYPKRKKS